MLDSKPLIFRGTTDFPPLIRGQLQTLQVNLGYRCNLSCTHCHVNAGPKRTEEMSRETILQIIDVLDHCQIQVLDLTGGAPEMNPHFCFLVEAARSRGIEVIDRCNLTILNEPGYEEMAHFLADNNVKIVASLPCYSQKNVEAQRGKGVFGGSITGLKKLNEQGYGLPGASKTLDLVYNPGGAFLPPDQVKLEQDYKQRLQEDFGVQFTHLLTLANMPISRFGSMLMSKGLFDDYMVLLKDSFNASNLQSVMCLNTISVDWMGYLYDCDFNQMLEMSLKQGTERRHIGNLLENRLNGCDIAVADHCFGCTAGQGSSCGGALA